MIGDIESVLEALNNTRVRYLVVGGRHSTIPRKIAGLEWIFSRHDGARNRRLLSFTFRFRPRRPGRGQGRSGRGEPEMGKDLLHHLGLGEEGQHHHRYRLAGQRALGAGARGVPARTEASSSWMSVGGHGQWDSMTASTARHWTSFGTGVSFGGFYRYPGVC
jgi:hypothetical protein